MKTSSFFTVFFLMVVSLNSSIKIFGQCCAAGSPASVNPDLQVLRKGSFTTKFSMRYSASDVYYQGDRALNVVPLITGSDYWFGQFTAGYTLFKGIEVNAGLGYYLKKSEHYNSDLLHSDNGFGFTDVVLGTRALLWRSTTKGRQFYGLVNVTLPTGQFDLVRNGVKLPVQLQPSSGAFKVQTALQYLTSVPEIKTDFFGQIDYELNTWIHSTHFNYKFGNYSSLTLGAYHNLTNYFTMGLQIRYELRERSARDENIILEATGFRQMCLIPLISARLPHKMVVSFLPQIPVYRYYNGVQLANSWSVTLSFALTL